MPIIIPSGFATNGTFLPLLAQGKTNCLYFSKQIVLWYKSR